MSSPGTLRGLALPAALERQLAAYRHRVWWVKLLEATSMALSGVGGAYLCLFAIDRLWDTPAGLRAVLACASAAACSVIPLYVYRWMWRHRHFDQLARLLAKRMPRLGDQLLSVIELADSADEQSRSPELCEAALAQTAHDAARQDLTQATPPARLRSWGALAGMCLAVTAGLCAAAPDAAWNAWQRLTAPWSDIDRYTFAALEPLPDTLVVAHGEPHPLELRLRPNTSWRPETAALQVASQTQLAPLRDDAYALSIPPLIAPVAISASAGDWRHTLQVEPRLRPELSALQVEVRLPAYLQRSAPLERDGRSGVVGVLRGSEAVVTAEINRPLREATSTSGEVAVDADRIRLAPARIDAPREFALTWRDQDGLAGKEPFGLRIDVEEDLPPSIAVSELPRRKVVLDSEQLDFRFAAGDDYGVREVGMEWRALNLNPSAAADAASAPLGERLLAAGSGDSPQLAGQGVFQAQQLGIEPQPIEVRLFVADYCPDRPREYSAPCVLYVLTPEEHAVWITEQLSKWHRQSLEVRDRELQLYEENKRLRALDPAELDAPENRRRLEQQATAEKAQGRRLTGLTRSGAELLKQASRNPEMGVGHLERWAAMLETLNDIAANRMPSVADLLKEATAAPLVADQRTGGPQAGQNRDARGAAGQPAESAPKPTPVVPQIVDRESSQQPSEPPGSQQPSNAKPSNPSLRLPVTTLAGSSQGKQPPGSAPEQVAEAVAQQRDLLAEFEKVANELNEVLGNLEGSTLVKRLKSASREQYQIAGGLGDSVDSMFGRSPASYQQELRAELKNLSTREETSSLRVSSIMDDMEAYFERRRMVRFKNILEQMRTEDVIGNLRRLSEHIVKERGVAMAECEYWSDALDRWAEDLVDPANSGACPGCRSKGSLPPSIVLEVLKILEGEINLREATRVAEQARAALGAEDYATEAGRLGDAQTELEQRIVRVVERIRELPDGDADFAKEINLLGRVGRVMDEAARLLSSPDTGPPAIAAETEAIELLLQSKRINPQGGGGGGANPGGGGSGDTRDAALALIGPGLNAQEVREDRGAPQTTGETGSTLPAEFRAGLDRYFNELEQGAGG